MNRLLEELGELLRYPDQRHLQRLDEALKLVAAEGCKAPLQRFREQSSALPLGTLQELYTRTFDLSPLCSLEVGWQLYGEDYARGSFLVYMRSQLLEHGVAERGELPDHLAHVLPAISRMPKDKGNELREGAALPAVQKMLKAFDGKPNPYADLLRAIAFELRAATTDRLEETSHV